MKIAILNAFPIIDYLYYKKYFLSKLVKVMKDTDEALIVYSCVKFTDYYKFSSRNINRLLDREKKRKKDINKEAYDFEPRAEESRGSFMKLASKLGLEIKKFSRFGDASCINYLEKYKPDLAFNLSGQYIPQSILRIPEFGIVGAHYGLLPQLRGRDTIRWSILLDIPIFVCHMFLKPELDMGDIISRVPISVYKSDSYSIIRKKCQIINASYSLNIYNQLCSGELEREPQKREEGSTFYEMGTFLRRKVDDILRKGLYKHYAIQEKKENTKCLS